MVVYSSTPLIKLSDKSYPKYLSDFKRENPNVSIGTYIYSENLEPFGYMPVTPMARPVGNVVTEAAPEFNDIAQEWQQRWDVRDYNEAELNDIFLHEKSALSSQAMNIYMQDIQTGADVDGKVVPLEDYMLTQLLVIKDLSSQAAEGETFQVKASGEIIELPAEEMVAFITSVFKEFYAIKKAYWKLIEEIKQAPSREELPIVPETLR